MNQRTRIAIGIGSNLGDRYESIQQAISWLSQDVLEDSRVSTLYETKPWGYLDQPNFLNAVVVGTTEWKPPAILNAIKNYEREKGRVIEKLYGPRVIDLDLLAFGELTWESPGVQIPHPGMAHRIFVLKPFSELWPDWSHPILHKTVSELLESLGDCESEIWPYTPS